MMGTATPGGPLRWPSSRDMQEAWIFATSVWFVQCMMIAAAGSTTALITLRAAQAATADDMRLNGKQEMRGHVDNLSLEECLAIDHRGTGCRALGEPMNRVTTPLRRDLILASALIC